MADFNLEDPYYMRNGMTGPRTASAAPIGMNNQQFSDAFAFNQPINKNLYQGQQGITNMAGFTQPATTLPATLSGTVPGTPAPSWGQQAWSGVKDTFGSITDGLFDKKDPTTGMVTQGSLMPIAQAAGAISNAYLGYKGLEEAKRNRQMQEKYAAANLANSATAYNANVRDIAANNSAINNWSDDRTQQYIDNNQAQSTI